MLGQKLFVYGTQSMYWHHGQKLASFTEKNATQVPAKVTRRSKRKIILEKLLTAKFLQQKFVRGSRANEASNPNTKPPMCTKFPIYGKVPKAETKNEILNYREFRLRAVVLFSLDPTREWT